jgi:pimeloyl-ACP methyl ester carboxylesterase
MDELVALDTAAGGYMESQSGLQRSKPRIYGRMCGGTERDLAFLVAHPTSNFFGHYLLRPIAQTGATLLALNTRYIGNDSMLMMERAIQDVGAGMAFLRRQGFKKVVLIGNSGGGSLAAFYQQQATSPTLTTTPDGRAFDITTQELPPADGIALVAAHTGRADQLLNKIDPSLHDEVDPLGCDSSLDMFDPANGPSYSEQWVAAYREAQEIRLRRIVDWVQERLAFLESVNPPETADAGFIVHRTQADPRNLDLTLDASDRALGSLGGEARNYNFAANGLARFCTLRSFLSQWSPWHTRAHGPTCLADVRQPKLIVDHTADQTVFPSQIQAWRQAAGDGADYLALRGGTHYLNNQPELISRLTDCLISWGKGL